jgi:hypothetical protein
MNKIVQRNHVVNVKLASSTTEVAISGKSVTTAVEKGFICIILL